MWFALEPFEPLPYPKWADMEDGRHPDMWDSLPPDEDDEEDTDC